MTTHEPMTTGLLLNLGGGDQSPVESGRLQDLIDRLTGPSETGESIFDMMTAPRPRWTLDIDRSIPSERLIIRSTLRGDLIVEIDLEEEPEFMTMAATLVQLDLLLFDIEAEKHRVELRQAQDARHEQAAPFIVRYDEGQASEVEASISKAELRSRSRQADNMFDSLVDIANLISLGLAPLSLFHENIERLGVAEFLERGIQPDPHGVAEDTGGASFDSGVVA